METFWWIVGSGVLMSVIALSGSVTLLLSEAALRRILTPLVAFAAGALLGGAFFHMIPAAADRLTSSSLLYSLVMAGFAVFFAMEQFLHWHHCHREAVACRKPLGYLILIGDALHNFLGGLAIGGIFLIDIRLGVLAWLAAAAHEVPQELGDFAVLLHGGWSKRSALLLNLLSGLCFLVGGVIAYAVGQQLDVTWLIPFAAGNFIYIGASDLIPEVKAHEKLTDGFIHFGAFLLGAGLLLAVQLVGH